VYSQLRFCGAEGAVSLFVDLFPYRKHN
jgi:hypothetical protein